MLGAVLPDNVSLEVLHYLWKVIALSIQIARSIESPDDGLFFTVDFKPEELTDVSGHLRSLGCQLSSQTALAVRALPVLLHPFLPRPHTLLSRIKLGGLPESQFVRRRNPGQFVQT